MRSSSDALNLLVDRTYRECREAVYRYILKRLECEADSEDLTQDAFLRLLDYGRLLREDTVRHFLFAIVRNLVTDWLRRHYKRQEVSSYLMEGLPKAACDTESQVIADDILRLEMKKVETLSKKCRAIYMMSRFEEMTADEIAEQMNVSKRTVEGHILFGRRRVREYIRQCI